MTELLEKPTIHADDGGDPSVPPQPNPGNPPPQNPDPPPKKLPNDTEEPEPQGLSNIELRDRDRDEMEYLRALLAA